MKVLISSHSFYPAIGGIETMSILLATELERRGHSVAVVTETEQHVENSFSFQVIRRPNILQLFKAAKECDVFFQNNISLKSLWPICLFRRPWIVCHHTWIRRHNGSISWEDFLKRFLLKFSHGISVSKAIAEDISTPTTIIENPYRDNLFKLMPDITRDRDLVFLGRLVSDKGADLLLHAVKELKARGQTPTVTIIGDGPQLETLRNLTKQGDICSQVHFAGPMSGVDLVAMLNRHRILVVPSVWNEPFGLVALEGIACGCVVVGSSGGGLRDAIGPCGVTFPNGDVNALYRSLEMLLTSEELVKQFRASASTHLEKHTIQYVTDRYMKVIEQSVTKNARQLYM